jgi:hypothetical protein
MVREGTGSCSNEKSIMVNGDGECSQFYNFPNFWMMPDTQGNPHQNESLFKFSYHITFHP